MGRRAAAAIISATVTTAAPISVPVPAPPVASSAAIRPRAAAAFPTIAAASAPKIATTPAIVPISTGTRASPAAIIARGASGVGASVIRAVGKSLVEGLFQIRHPVWHQILRR